MSHRNEFTPLYETEREFHSSLKSRNSIMQTPEEPLFLMKYASRWTETLNTSADFHSDAYSCI